MNKKRKKKQKDIVPIIVDDKAIVDKAKTDDIKTNDFDLIGGKIPPASTVRRQLKIAETLVRTAQTVPIVIQFDRLKIAVNLILHGRDIGFSDWGLEDVDDPMQPPSYITDRRQKQNNANKFLNEDDEDEDFNLDDFYDEADFDVDSDEVNSDDEVGTGEVIEAIEEPTEPHNNEADIFTDRRVKRRVRYSDVKDIVGVNNIYLSNGFIFIDITGKFMAGNNDLGSITSNNIHQAIERVLDIGVIGFDADRFIEVAQVFVCDVCVDLLLNSKQQVARYIDGISSFMPLASNRFNITKYGRHGLQMTPKAKTLGTSLIVYSKGQELSYRLDRTTKATMYTDIIGTEGVRRAERTLRLELKIYSLRKMRQILNVPHLGFGVVALTDVLNSSVPVMLQQFELFCGSPERLLDRITWLHDITIAPDSLTLAEIFAAERFVEIFTENNFDLNITRSHIRTEYINVGDTELEYFNKLANLQQNVLNFLVYRKPKSITVMLDMIRRLQTYYNFDTETAE